MKFLPLTASLMALALFSAPAFAQEEAPAQEQPPAAVEEAAPQVPEEVLVLLNDTRPLTRAFSRGAGRPRQAGPQFLENERPPA